MKRLLYHVSQFKVDWLDPDKYDEKCICLSEDCFLAYFGQVLYILDKDLLERDLRMERQATKGLTIIQRFENHHFKFTSDELGWEYRVYDKIDVNKYAIDVVINMNLLIGHIEEVFYCYLIKDWIKKKERIELCQKGKRKEGCDGKGCPLC